MFKKIAFGIFFLSLVGGCTTPEIIIKKTTEELWAENFFEGAKCFVLEEKEQKDLCINEAQRKIIKNIYPTEDDYEMFYILHVVVENPPFSIPSPSSSKKYETQKGDIYLLKLYQKKYKLAFCSSKGQRKCLLSEYIITPPALDRVRGN